MAPLKTLTDSSRERMRRYRERHGPAANYAWNHSERKKMHDNLRKTGLPLKFWESVGHIPTEV